MTAEHPQEYVATNENIECLCDYFYAALAHAESNAHLDRLWMQELGVIRSRPHSSAKSEQEIRPSVMRFAIAMEKVLQENDYKGDWYGCDFPYLFGGVGREYYEAKKEWSKTKTPEGYHKTARELIDVANFCMMFYDNLYPELRSKHGGVP